MSQGTGPIASRVPPNWTPPDAWPPDGDADTPPDEQVARKEASMKPIFNTGRGRGAMLATAVAPAAAAHV